MWLPQVKILSPSISQTSHTHIHNGRQVEHHASLLNEALNCTSPSSSATDGGTRLRQFARRRHCSSSVLPPTVRQQFKDACGDHFPPWSSHSKAIMSFPAIRSSRRWSLSYSYKPVEALRYAYCCRLRFENVIKQ